MCDKIQSHKTGGVSIGNVSGGINNSMIAGGDVHNAQLDRHVTDPTDVVAQNPALQSLRMILSTLYESADDARRLAQDAGLDTRQINFSTKPVTFWHNLLIEAHKQERVKAVVSAASFEYEAQMEILRHAYQQYVR